MLKICLTGSGYSEKNISDLKTKGFEVTHKLEHLTKKELYEIIPLYDAYVLGGDERLGEEELKIAKNLRVISFVGTGYTSFIDEAAATKYAIEIKNTPAVMAPAVAEHTIGLLIGIQRKLFQQNWQVKNSAIEISNTQELSSLCIGVVGLGEIGTRVAKILRQSFDSQVIYHSRSRKPDIENELGITSVSMEQLFSSSDIIILALPTTPETEYFVDDFLLEKARTGVVIINTAGARLIDPKSLKKYIDNNKISSVALDGYYIEPLPSVNNDPYQLLSLPDARLVVTAHTAAKTTQSWSRMMDMAIKNAIDFFNE